MEFPEKETGGLLTAPKAMGRFLELLYAGQSLQRKTWEKPERNAEIYRRFLGGEDSVVLARAVGLSDRRVRSIIAPERKRHMQCGVTHCRDRGFHGRGLLIGCFVWVPKDRVYHVLLRQTVLYQRVA